SSRRSEAKGCAMTAAASCSTPSEAATASASTAPTGAASRRWGSTTPTRSRGTWSRRRCSKSSSGCSRRCTSDRYPPVVATSTRRFGTGKREAHDSSAFYARGLASAEFSHDDLVNDAPELDRVWCHSAESMPELPDACVGLMVTSPPYHAGKDYDTDDSFEEYLGVLERVFAEVHRVLEPGGRAVVNV